MEFHLYINDDVMLDHLGGIRGVPQCLGLTSSWSKSFLEKMPRPLDLHHLQKACDGFSVPSHWSGILVQRECNDPSSKLLSFWFWQAANIANCSVAYASGLKRNATSFTRSARAHDQRQSNHLQPPLRIGPQPCNLGIG